MGFLFGSNSAAPITKEDIRHLSTARLKREAVRLIREARTKDDYLLALTAIEDILYRTTADPKWRNRQEPHSGGGGGGGGGGHKGSHYGGKRGSN